MVALLKTTQIQEPSSASVNITLDSSGNVGVGTTPAALLDVFQSSAGTYLRAGTNNTARQLTFTSSTTTSPGDTHTIDSTSATGQIRFATNGSERARIDSVGYMQGTVNGLSAGRIPAMQYYRLNSNLAGANVNTVQSVFGVGVTLVGSTQYAFEANYIFTKTAGTTANTHGLGFGGTATINNILYTFSTASVGGALPILETTPQTGAVNTASNTTVTTSSTGATTSRSITIRGTVSINAGGTFIPQYTLSAAPGGAYSTAAGSYFAIYPLAASGSDVNIGSWA